MTREDLQKIVDSKAALTDLNSPHHYKQALVYDQWALRVDMARALLAIHDTLDVYQDKSHFVYARHEALILAVKAALGRDE